MPLSLPGRVVVFDYGEVISRSPSAEERGRLATIAGVDVAGFTAAYDRHRDALDHGRIDVPEYWDLVASDLGVRLTPAQVHELWTIDFRSWVSIDPDTYAIIVDLAAGGTRVALLSNAGFDFAGALPHSPISRYFERMFFSAPLDRLKPDPEIYLHVVRELGITPDQMVFIDNKSVNTDAAAALGITVHHFTGAAGLGAFLRSLAD